MIQQDGAAQQVQQVGGNQVRLARNGDTVSVPGVYGGFADKLPVGSLMNRSLTL